MSRSVSRRLSLGPVFAYEWIRSSRRWQGYALRSSFVLFLVMALAYVWMNTSSYPAKSNIRLMAELGEWFFQAVIGTQLTLALLAAPAATAGALCLDKARGTLTHMLMTDLADFEIVLGKLAARLVPVVGLVACTLPMMELLILLGGVASEALWGAFVVTLGVALLGCSLGLWFSLWLGKTHEALLGTYALWVFCAGAAITSLGLAIGTWFSQLGRAVAISVGIYLFVTLSPCYLAPMLWARNDGSALLSPLVWAGTMTVDLAAPSVVVTPIDWAIFWMLMWALVAVGLLSTTLASFDRRLGRVETVVARLARPSRWAQIAAMICFTLGAIFSLDALLGWPVGARAFWLNGVPVTVALFVVGAAAATSLFEGRDVGGVDLLMSSELSSGRIVLAKWLGACRLLPALLIVPAWVVIRCGAPLLGLLLLIAYLLSISAAVISLGQACATAFKQRGRALAATAGLIGLVSVAGPLLADLRTAGAGTRNLAMGSPCSGANAMTLELAGYHSSELSFTIWALGWSLGYCICAAVLLGITIATFDRRLGRAATGGRRSALVRALQARAAPVTPQ